MREAGSDSGPAGTPRRGAEPDPQAFCDGRVLTWPRSSSGASRSSLRGILDVVDAGSPLPRLILRVDSVPSPPAASVITMVRTTRTPRPVLGPRVSGVGA